MNRATTRARRPDRAWRPGTGHETGLRVLEARVLLTVLPEGFVETVVAPALSTPTAMELAPDGRVFVAQQTGEIVVVRPGESAPARILKLDVDSRGERGLVGLELDPDFATNGYLYVYYTLPTTPARNRISRFELHDDHVHAESEQVLLELDPLPSDEFVHNGGAMHFAADGTLFVGVGDNMVSGSGQRLDHFGGKMLRINRDGSIPADNPFNEQATGPYRAIWAMGLRNPFTFALEPTSGRMFINDVGTDRYEEINEGQAGANYGWSVVTGPAGNPAYRDPLYAYEHVQGYGGACAITGGTFYQPAQQQFPADYRGAYFFADFCGNWIRVYDPATGVVRPFAAETGRPPAGTDLGQLGQPPIDLDVDAAGSLFYLTRNWQGEGQVRRIDYAPGTRPAVAALPASQVASLGQPVVFAVQASGSLPLTYQWQRDGRDIPGATGPSYTLTEARLTDSNARFRVVVSNSHGRVTSTEVVLSVVNGRPPLPEILSPGAGFRYQPGLVVSFAGQAIDPEQGRLPAAALRWRIDFHHDDHVHPFVPETMGIDQGTFTIPAVPHDPGTYWYRITLTATDGTGLTTSVYRDITPGEPVEIPGPVLGGLVPGRWTPQTTTTTRRQAVFQGSAPARSLVTLLAHNEATGQTTSLGRVRASSRGAWRMTARGLPNGAYRVLATWSANARAPLAPWKPLWSLDLPPLVVAVPPRRWGR